MKTSLLFLTAMGLLFTPPRVKTILFFGDSLTAGYGVGVDQAFPAIIGHRIDSLHWPYKVVNAGLSGTMRSKVLSVSGGGSFSTPVTR